jgi:CHAT domain-containing protein
LELRTLSLSSDEALEVLTANATADLIHVAAHGIFASDNPMASGIELSRAGESAVLALDSLVGTDMKADFIFLSGCETGRVAALANQEVLGLMSFLLGQHVSAAVLSFWPVPAASDSILELVAEFYRRWLDEGLPKGEALRQAMLAQKSARLYDWAGFALFGYGL